MGVTEGTTENAAVVASLLADLRDRGLEALARSLVHNRPGAAASLREGPADTLTLTRLGITGS